MAKIMVVDDDNVMRGLLSTLLGMEGDDVVLVWQKDRIVPVAREENPDLILLDLHLGGEDVLPVIAELKSDAALRSIPILAASGMDRQPECERAGAEGFILKPFRPGELIDRIRAMLERYAKAETSA